MFIPEIIEQIVQYLSIKDIYNLMNTCTYINTIVKMFKKDVMKKAKERIQRIHSSVLQWSIVPYASIGKEKISHSSACKMVENAIAMGVSELEDEDVKQSFSKVATMRLALHMNHLFVYWNKVHGDKNLLLQSYGFSAHYQVVINGEPQVVYNGW